MNNSTFRTGVGDWGRIGKNAKPNKLNMLQLVGQELEFGDRFALGTSTLSRTNQIRGIEMAKQTLKKAKKLEATKPLIVVAGR